MDEVEAIRILAPELGITLQEKDHLLWRKILIDRINHLIQNDFERLIGILYRIDVSEKKIRQFLEFNTGEDAAPAMADLIIERQLQKIESRKHYRNDDPVDEEDKW